MTTKKRAASRAHKPNSGAVDALNTLPGNLCVTLQRDTGGTWECGSMKQVAKATWASSPYYGEGNTANEAAAAFLAQYHGQAERERIDQALTKTNGDKKAAAALLGISRKTLYRRLETTARV